MPKINLTGNITSDKPKIVVPNDTWDAEIKGVSDIMDVAKYEKPEETEEKLTLDVELSLNDGRKVILPMFLSAVISKGGSSAKKNYNNSKLYNILDMAGQLKGVEKIAEEIGKMTDENLKRNLFVDFLRKVLISKKCRATTKIVNKGTPDEYSRIAEIARFL